MAEAPPARPSSAAAPPAEVIFNVPNQLSIARLVLSLVCFCFLIFDGYLVALVLFLLAAGTDWVDGYWARKYGQITQLGRILDPFADKIVICGTFIFLAAVPPTVTGRSASEITAWMAVLVVGREMLVTALRSFFEEQGVDFSAQWAGKWKMVFQCAAVGGSLYRLWYYGYGTTSPTTWAIAAGTEPPLWTTWSLRLVVWLAIALTIYSGWGYVQAGFRMLRR